MEVYMTASLNKVKLFGYLGKGPEQLNFEDGEAGGRVVKFSLATSESWADRDTGERCERTHWHQIAVFNDALTEITLQHLRKGSLVYVEGQLETRKWQGRDGTDHYATEVVLRPYRTITMLDPALRAAKAPSPNRQANRSPAPR
jgi:single-strand DNA-binding protein